MRTHRCVALLFLSACAGLAQAPTDGWLVWERGAPAPDQPRRIWVSRLDGSDKRPLTDEGSRMPTWSPDGRWISYYDEAGGSGRVLHLDGSDDRKICDGRPLFWLFRESEVVCLVDGRYERVDPDTGRRRILFATLDFTALGGKRLEISGISADLRFAVGWSDRYRRRFRGDNGTYKAYHTAILLDLHTPEKLYAIGQGCEPTLSPGDDWIYHVGASGPNAPDIFRVPTSAVLESNFVERAVELGYEPEIGLPDEDWGHTYFPRISAGDDHTWLVYGATSARDGDEICHDHDPCPYQIFLHRLGSPPTAVLRVTYNRDSNTWPHLFLGEPTPTLPLR